MKTLVTKITERGQTSIPAPIRRRMQLQRGARILWRAVSDRECTIVVQGPPPVEGPVSMLGYARTFRSTRSTGEWMKELREGERG